MEPKEVPSAKVEALPKVRVEPERKERYYRAYEAWVREHNLPELTFAYWIRDALDKRADEILGNK